MKAKSKTEIAIDEQSATDSEKGLDVVSNRIPKSLEIIGLPVLSILLSLTLVAGLIWAIGENPFEAIYHLFFGVFGYPEGFGYSLYYATNFMFTGLAVAVAFHCGHFNIGGEGQAAVGGLITALFILATDRFLPGWVVVPLAILAAFAGGALWALIPALLQVWKGSHLVITTIMFNFIASGLILWLILDFMVLPGNQAPESRAFAPSVDLWQLDVLLRKIGFNIGQTPANFSFVIAIAVAIICWIFLFYTRAGFEIRVIGAGKSSGKFAGINIQKTTVIAICVAGGMAGLMAVNEIVAVNNKLIAGFTGGFGFVGIAVSLMGRNHPLGIIPAALLFGFLFQGGTELNFEMPQISREMTVVVQGLIILFVGALPALMLPPLRFLYLTISRKKTQSNN